MGMYNAVHGWHHDSGTLIKMLEIGDKWRIGRFRDAWLNVGGTEICVFTRNGGGNRECWDPEGKEGGNSESCECAGCVITHHIPKHPNYLRDEDDSFDETYAYIYFSVPECYKSLAALMAPKEPEPTLKEKTDRALGDDMEGLTAEQLSKRYPELGKIWDKITKALEETDAANPEGTSDLP